MKRIKGIEVDDFTVSYLETALWASTVLLPVASDDLIDGCMDVAEDHPLYGISEDDHFDDYFDSDDFTEKVIRTAIADCFWFQKENANDLSDEDLERAGHDFWLTRNGYGAGFLDGAGFWDGDYEEAKGNRLSNACDAYGELNIWASEDGSLHF